MNSITKTAGVGAIVALVFALGLAFDPPKASAAVSFDPIAPVVFDNGNGWESNVDTSAGNTIRTKLIVDITADDDVGAVSYDFIGDFIPKVCIQLPQEQTQSVNDFPVEFDMLAPSTPGSWDVQFVAYGNNGPEPDFNCTNAVDTQNIYDRVIVNIGDTNTAGSTGGGSGVGSNSALAQLQASVALLAQKVADLLAGKGTPAPSQQNTAKCAAITPYLTAQMNTYSALGVQLQSALLLDNPYAIPALKPGSSVPMGYRGPQTEAALSSYLSTYRCGA